MSDIPRRPTAFGNNPASGGQAPSRESNAAALTERFNALRKERDLIHATRMRREVELDNALRTEQQCAQEAQALGVNSIDELREFISKREQQDMEALDQLERQLEEQRELLRTIEERVAQADAR